jgi:hypothetical protein
MFERTFNRWRRFLPEGSVCVVVDDASDTPLTGISNGSHYRLITHENRLGVAMTKNDGIAALMEAGCDDLFLSDDDIAPVRGYWWMPYVNSPERHLSYQWPNRRLHNGRDCGDGAHFQVDAPRGVLLYAHRSVIDEVGGMDPAYGAWGNEHVEWQARIHDAGLTTWPYADVVGSEGLWGEHYAKSTIPANKRKHVLACNEIQWQKLRPRFVSYRQDDCVQDYTLGPVIEDTGRPYYALRHAVDMQPAGVAVEFGVGTGTSTCIMAEHMPVVGFDSGKGLPETWRSGFPKHSLAFGIPVVENATVVEGWFADTLPGFDFESLGYIGLVHLDADLYSSTETALKYIGPHLRPGCYVCFDEWWGYNGASRHEQRAWKEFAADTGIGWTVVGHGDQQWVIRITGIAKRNTPGVLQ